MPAWALSLSATKVIQLLSHTNEPSIPAIYIRRGAVSKSRYSEKHFGTLYQLYNTVLQCIPYSICIKIKQSNVQHVNFHEEDVIGLN